MPEASRSPLASLLQRLLHNRIFMSSTFIMAVSFAGGLINFVFNVLMGRMLGNEQYGIVYPLISLSMIIGLPAKALLYVMTRDFSELLHRGRPAVLKGLMQRFVRWFLIITLLLLGVLVLLMPVLKNYLHITDNRSFYLVYLYILAATLSGPYNSLIQSRERFFWAGVGQFLTVAVKFVTGYLLVRHFHHYHGVLWGILAGALVVFVLYFLDSLSFQPDVQPEAGTSEGDTAEWYSLQRIFKGFALAMVSIGFFQLITYIDSVLVRHLLPELSGVYSVANQMGKASFFIATGVSFVLLPFMSKEKQHIHKNNLRGLLFLLMFLAAYVAVISLGRNLIADVLFQGKYPGLKEILPLYTVMFIPYAAISYLVNYYFLSQKLIYSFTILGGAVLQVLGIYLFHRDLVQVSLVVGVTGYMVLGVLLLDSFLLRKAAHPASKQEEQLPSQPE